MSLNPGRLRHRVTIEHPVSEDDGMGGQVEVDHQPIATVWAAIEPLTGDERLRAQQITPTLSHRVTMRRREVSESWRIRFGERVFGITAIIVPNEAGGEMHLMCEETK